MSQELKQFLHDRGDATSRTASFNPAENGQMERLINGTLWRVVALGLNTLKLPTNCLQEDETPHQSFFDFEEDQLPDYRFNHG